MASKNPYAQLTQILIDHSKGISQVERSRIDRVKERVAESLSEEMFAIRQIIDEDPHEFGILLCEAILEIEHPNNNNPFALTEKGTPIQELSEAKRYKDWAEIVLGKLKKETSFNSNDEYITLKQLIIKYWYVDRDFYSPNFSSPKRGILIREFFEVFEEELGSAIRAVCEILLEGMPLFEQSHSGEYILVPYNNEEYIYLRQKGKLEWSSRQDYIPGWASKYYIKQEHLRLYEIFFGNSDGKEETVRILRTAFLRHIGLESRLDAQVVEQAERKERTHKTKLLRLVDAVIDRYYGPNFDPLNNDTWPTQETVVSWLRLEHGLSGREATAVDIISRPDAIRGKY